MADIMFKFLRFEIGGLATLLWMLIFLAPSIDIENILSGEVVTFLGVLFSSIVVSFPLGNYVHQIADSMLCPYSFKRFYFISRKSIEYLRKKYSEKLEVLQDKNYQAVFVLSQSVNTTTFKNEADSGHSQQSSINVDVLREGVRSRYSYYYARVECGLFAPIIGYGFSKILVMSGIGGKFLVVSHATTNYLLVLLIIMVCIGMLWRIPQLFKEIDDLEIALLSMSDAQILEMLGNVSE